MRRLFPFTLGLMLICGLLVPFPSLCQEEGAPIEAKEEKPAASRRSPKPAFKPKSELVARIPAVAASLAQVEADPQDPLAWRQLGKSLSVNGAHADAVRALRKATGLDRRNPGPYIDLGAAYLRYGKPGPAGGAFKTALRLEPLHPLAHYNLGLVYQLQDKYDASLAEFEQALLIDPDLANPRKNAGASNNPELPYVNLRVYLKTTGSAPALFSLGTKEDLQFAQIARDQAESRKKKHRHQDETPEETPAAEE